MANIGTFTKTEQGFVGEIVTLIRDTKFGKSRLVLLHIAGGWNDGIPASSDFVWESHVILVSNL